VHDGRTDSLLANAALNYVARPKKTKWPDVLQIRRSVDVNWYTLLIEVVCTCACVPVKLSAIHGEDGELSNFLGHRGQHNDGDGTSGSSHGTSSPDSFRARETAAVLKARHHQQVPPAAAAAAETQDDVIVMPHDLLAGTLRTFFRVFNSNRLCCNRL